MQSRFERSPLIRPVMLLVAAGLVTIFGLFVWPGQVGMAGSDVLNLANLMIIVLIGLLVHREIGHRQIVHEIAGLRRQLSASYVDRRRTPEQYDLTEVMNRDQFYQRVQRFQHINVHGTLLLLEVDDFTQFSKAHGQLAGEKVLDSVANCLRSSIRDSDLMGRFDGESFAIFLRGARKMEAHLVAERIRKAVERFELETGPSERHFLTVSVGGVVNAQDFALPEAMETAGASLSTAKKNGSNSIVIHGGLSSVA